MFDKWGIAYKSLELNRTHWTFIHVVKKKAFWFTIEKINKIIVRKIEKNMEKIQSLNFISIILVIHHLVWTFNVQQLKREFIIFLYLCAQSCSELNIKFGSIQYMKKHKQNNDLHLSTILHTWWIFHYHSSSCCSFSHSFLQFRWIFILRKLRLCFNLIAHMLTSMVKLIFFWQKNIN